LVMERMKPVDSLFASVFVPKLLGEALPTHEET